MNQILITGEEQVTRKVNEKVKKSKNVVPINGIIIFYAISIIILGICMISGTVYAKEKINETIEANTKPEISLTINNDNTVTINVTHIRGIKNIVYRWNDEKEITIDGKNEKRVSETIALIGGENTLKVTATEENGQTSKLEKTYKSTVPKIEINSVDNGVQIIATSEKKIDYVQYSWDYGEMQKIEVGKEKYEGIINVLKGKHTLKIETVNLIGEKTTEERIIDGATEPTVNIKSELVNEKATFVIDAEDEVKITTLEIIHNGGEKQTIEVNAKTYHKEIVMTEGEVNTIIVRATNGSGLTGKKGVKFTNK